MFKIILKSRSGFVNENQFTPFLTWLPGRKRKKDALFQAS